MPQSYYDQLLTLARQRKILRSKDLAEKGIPRQYLRIAEERGALERRGRGIYIDPHARVSPFHLLAQAVRRVPRGIVCLLSALHYHGLTTQQPHEVWLALDSKWQPRVDYPPLRLVRFSGAARDLGVKETTIDGVKVRVYSPAKTVVDCFRFRNKIGLDVAIEALRDYRQKRMGSADELFKIAEACRATRVMRPHMDAVYG